MAAFLNSVFSTLQSVLSAIGAGLAIWGLVNLMEGYGSDNPAAKSSGIKQIMAGFGIVLIATIIPTLASLVPITK